MRLQESGIAVVSSTMRNGTFALRAAMTNRRSPREDFEMVVEAVAKIGIDVAKAIQSKDFARQKGAANA